LSAYDRWTYPSVRHSISGKVEAVGENIPLLRELSLVGHLVLSVRLSVSVAGHKRPPIWAKVLRE